MLVYAVIRGDGLIKRTKGRSLMIYAGLTPAKAQARADGDSVVEVEIDLSKPPLFIRGRKLDGNT